MSKYLYRLARFAFRRRRLILGVWLLAAIAAIVIGQASGGKTNDTFTIPGTESQNAANVLTARLPAFSGGQSTIGLASHRAVTAAMEPVQAAGLKVEYNGSVYPGWQTVISETPELIGLVIAFIILMITFGAFAAAGMPILGAIIGA